jgi:methylthioribose-1-phosphate isomerase
MHPPIFSLLLTIALSANISQLLTSNLLSFSYLATSYIAPQGSALYTVAFDTTNQLTINNFIVQSGQLLPNQTYSPQQQQLVKWEMQLL